MLPDGCAIGVVAGGSQTGASNIFEPVLKPGLNCPPLTGPRNRALIAQTLKRSDLLDHLTLCLATHVPTVGRAVIPETHRHASVPVSVVAEVHRGGAVVVSGTHST